MSTHINEMWWGRSRWWWTSALNTSWEDYFGEDRWLDIYGNTVGPGNPNTLFPTNLYTNQDKVEMISQFWLGKDRQKARGDYVRTSQPALEINGPVVADTFSGVLGDKPSAKAKLILTQTAKIGGSKLAKNSKSVMLADISNDPNEYIINSYGSYNQGSINFPSVNVPLESGTINIDLSAKIKLTAEGRAEVGFDAHYARWQDHPELGTPYPFRIRTPQWTL